MNAALATRDTNLFDGPLSQVLVPDFQPQVEQPDDMQQRADRAMKAARIADRVNQNYVRGVEYRQDWINDRTMSYDYKENRQWPMTTTGRGKKKVLVTVNRIFPALNRIMGFISKTKMSVSIEGVGPEDAILGKIFNRLFEEYGRKDRTEFKFYEAIKDSRTCGLGVAKEVWNRTLDRPYGRPELVRVRSDEIIVEPGAMDLQYEDSDWIIHEVRLTLEKARAKYPNYADIIVPDADWLRDTGKPQWFSTYTEHMVENRRGGIAPSSDLARDTVVLKEMWYRDYQRIVTNLALRNIDAILPGAPQPFDAALRQSSGQAQGSPEILSVKEGAEIPEGAVEALGLQEDLDFVAIPDVIGKVRVATVLNGTLIHDRPSPFAHEKFPFVFFKAIPLDKYSYPAGDVIFAVELQDIINKLYSIDVDQMVRSNYSPIVGEKGTLDPKMEEVLMKYGMSSSQLLMLKRGAKLDRLPPPHGIQEGFLLLLRTLSNSFDELMGFFAIDRADTDYPTSGKGMEELRLSSDVFHQPKSNPILHSLLWWADMRVSNMVHLMKQEVAVRVDDRLRKQIEQTGHRAFLRADQTGNASYALNKAGRDENMRPIILNDNESGKYDLKATISADFAATKRSEAEMAMGLKRMDIYDDQAVLDKLDDPNTEEILKRKDEKNSLLQLGQKVAENPVAMAVLQDPNLQAEIEAMLKARQPAQPAQ